MRSRIRPPDLSAASAPERHAAVYRAGQLEIIFEALPGVQDMNMLLGLMSAIITPSCLDHMWFGLAALLM